MPTRKSDDYLQDCFPLISEMCLWFHPWNDVANMLPSDEPQYHSFSLYLAVVGRDLMKINFRLFTLTTCQTHTHTPTAPGGGLVWRWWNEPTFIMSAFSPGRQCV